MGDSAIHINPHQHTSTETQVKSLHKHHLVPQNRSSRQMEKEKEKNQRIVKIISERKKSRVSIFLY